MTMVEVKYKIIMRLAERWGIEAFREGVDPRDYCERRFRNNGAYRAEQWTSVTRIVLTAFVIREHDIYKTFFHD